MPPILYSYKVGIMYFMDNYYMDMLQIFAELDCITLFALYVQLSFLYQKCQKNMLPTKKLQSKKTQKKKKLM